VEYLAMRGISSRLCTAVALVLTAVLIGSSTSWGAQSAAQAPSSPRAKAGEVVKQPLRDLNVMRDAIPEALRKAKAAPYAEPQEASCHAVRVEIYELDYALAEDLDAGKEEDDSFSKKVANETYNLARGAVSGLIPYRGILRRVTGAEKHAREINEALLAGAVRRSYLKGYGEALGCRYPAAPKRAEPAREHAS
jgi:hypothetical protein